MNHNGLYLHIPFCKSKCFYCDFYSVSQTSLKEEWLDALLMELKMEPVFLGSNRPVLRTVYFGGGTPTQLSYSELQRIFAAIDTYFDLSSCEEITIEANPDDLTPLYIAMLRKLPFNRISIGVQSFDDLELKAINRRHTALAAFEAIQECSRQGFDNISLDLMYGLPGQSVDSFLSSVNKAVTLPVNHLSSYSLSWEVGSVLYSKLQSGELKQADEELSEACFFGMKDILEKNGFEHYELSNFAKPGYHSKHNSSYWDGSYYLGVGPGAHSYNGLVRRFNQPSLKRYVEGVQRGGDFREVEELDAVAKYNDHIITRLRTLKGMDLTELTEMFGSSKTDYCLTNAVKSIRNGTLEQDGNQLRLTREGLFVSDAVMSDLLEV
ncbi:MAG TPA: radical SAM family heme chaperone HemW [Bacteroidales bacterium]|nr:radical SAM family heme chaperone HemW [Bacteroidales bacterium]